MEENKIFTDATPDYYNDGDISCIEAMVAAKGLEKTIAFCECCTFKYEWRLGKKDSIGKEVSKIKKYLDLYLELTERLECNRLGKEKGDIPILTRDSNLIGLWEAKEDIVARGGNLGVIIKEGEIVEVKEVLIGGEFLISKQNGEEGCVDEKCLTESFECRAISMEANLKNKGLSARQIKDILKQK